MAKKRGIDFLLEYAIEVAATDSMTSKPVSTVWNCFNYFGKDEPDEMERRKRKCSKNIRLFKKPWRDER
jgi:hypothetical protein